MLRANHERADGATVLRFSVASASGTEEVAVPVRAVLNFGYAARDQRAVREHVAELAERGIPGPATIPSLYGVLPDRVTTGATIRVVGARTYAEVEYALVLAPDGRWLLTVASDHTDALVEEADVARGKGITPDVLAPTAWWLDELAGRTDALRLTCEQLDGTARTVQDGPLSALLAPETLIETLTRRLGRAPEAGTVVLSGTIDGHPEPGAGRWRIAIEDPDGARRIEHEYAVDVVPDELHEPAAAR
jgi:Protein of unknown function (DUF2848)